MIGLHMGGDGPTKAYACHAVEVFAALHLEPLAGRTAAARRSTQPIERIAAPGMGIDGTQDLRRVIARDGLKIRGGPGTEFPTIGGLPAGQLVHVIASQGDWQNIDLEGDGRSDGFVHGAFLEIVTG